MTMKTFAPLAANYREAEAVPPPVGQACGWCQELITANNFGVFIPHYANGQISDLPWHFACYIRSVVGGINHQLKLCRCFGGVLPADPSDLNYYQAALVAFAYWRRTGLK